MKRKPQDTLETGRLRREAESRLRGRSARRARPAAVRTTTADTLRLCHELQVHQVELELQNAELQKSRQEVETALRKYTDLYDFAPAGYFSLDERGRILEVNLSGAALLGVVRSRLILRRLAGFVAPASQAVFRTFLERVFAGSGPSDCEVALVKESGAPFWGDLHGGLWIPVGTARRECRLAISDITGRRQAEAAGLRAQELSLANEQLQGQILRRQVVEVALRKSQEEQALLLGKSRHLQEQLRHLSHEILQAQEDERKRISRELHDEISQTLVSIHVDLASLSHDSGVSPAALRRKVARTQRLVERSITTVHAFARELRPASLDDLGLIASLHAFMGEFSRRTGLPIDFTAAAGGEKLNNARRTVVYRVVQAALANVARHAEATHVSVSLRRVRGAVRLRIRDNGKSFDVDRVLHARHNKRLGLIGMRERVEMVGGEFLVESAPGLGTTIVARIPLNESPGSRSRS